jgi:hypothetical protein
MTRCSECYGLEERPFRHRRSAWPREIGLIRSRCGQLPGKGRFIESVELKVGRLWHGVAV